MGPICTRAVFIFIIGYLGGISADTYPRDCSVCGSDPPGSFIIRHGKPMRSTTSFPWMVSLRSISGFNKCGAVILDEYFILTAAHCVVDTKGDIDYHIKVYFQTKSVKRMSRGATIEKFIIHPKYELVQSNATDILFGNYDIALGKLKKKIKCNTHKRPICLPSPDLQIPTGEANLIAGWGTPHPGTRGQTKILHYGTLKHLDFQECIKAVPETTMIKNHTLCLGGTKQTLCYGDSGSPLMKKVNSKCTVIGVATSETDQACLTSSPVIYTNVAKFVNWIKEQQKAFLDPDSFLLGNKQERRPRYPPKRCRERNYIQNKNWRFSSKKGQ